MSAQIRPKVWIVLVNWNGWRDSIECLESVFRQDYSNFGVILCDNDSSDGSLAAICDWARGDVAYIPPAGPLARLTTPSLPKPLPYRLLESGAQARLDKDSAALQLVPTGGNLGFAGGNNVGIRLALTDPDCAYVWLLNNDTVVEPDCLGHMVDRATTAPRAGITGSINYFYSDSDRVQALGGGTFSRYRVRSSLHAFGLQSAQLTPDVRAAAERRLDWVSGASMLVSRAFIERVGEMEERYFLYYEEIDWALRGHAEFRNAVALDARLYHKAGSATGEHSDSAFAVYTMCRSRFKLYRKFMPAWLPACHMRTWRDILAAVVKGRRVNARAMWRASVDDLLMRD